MDRLYGPNTIAVRRLLEAFDQVENWIAIADAWLHLDPALDSVAGRAAQRASVIAESGGYPDALRAAQDAAAEVVKRRWWPIAKQAGIGIERRYAARSAAVDAVTATCALKLRSRGYAILTQPMRHAEPGLL